MHTTEGAIVQRLISKLMLQMMIDAGVIDRADAIAEFRAVQQELARSGLDAQLQRRLVRELESIVRAIASDARQNVH